MSSILSSASDETVYCLSLYTLRLIIFHELRIEILIFHASVSQLAVRLLENLTLMKNDM